MLRKVYEYIKDDEFRCSIFKNRIHVENYNDICSLSSREVIIKTSYSIFKIIGDNLVLNKLLDKEVLIIGEVKNIEVIYE